MARSGFAGWLTPHYNGAIWFDKPPLFYWLTGICERLLGPSEFSARLGSAVMSLILLAATWRLSALLLPQRRTAPFWSAVVDGVVLAVPGAGAGAVTDMTLVAMLAWALYFFGVVDGPRFGCGTRC